MILFSSNKGEIAFGWQRELILFLFRAGLEGLPLLVPCDAYSQFGPSGICPGHQSVSHALEGDGPLPAPCSCWKVCSEVHLPAAAVWLISRLISVHAQLSSHQMRGICSKFWDPPLTVSSFSVSS